MFKSQYYAAQYYNALYWGANEEGGEPDPPVATSLTLTPSLYSGYPTNTVQLTATVYDQYAEVMVGEAVTYASSDELVATVDVNGLVTLVAEGTAVITATSGAASDTADIIVEAEPVFSAGDAKIVRRGRRIIIIQ